MAIGLPDEKIITLRRPIKLGDQEYQVLELREPLAGEMDKALSFGSGYTMQIALVSAVAAWPKTVVEKIPVSELAEASDYLLGFFNAGRPIGESSSPT